MLFSFKELKHLANLPKEISLDQVIAAINSIGFEVEGTSKFGDVEGIKFGKIVSVEKNPNADKLNVCVIGFSDKQRTIQTNADNVYPGMTVVAFIPGSRSGNIIFDSKEMKGVLSEGMLSSLNEFGISAELLREGAVDGIQEYGDIDLDSDPVEALGLADDIIDIDILSNRSDAQSYLVMAREIAAYFGTTPLSFERKPHNMETDIEVTPARHIELSFIEAKKDFTISMKEQILLTKSGIRTINDIVDLTNLTLIMTGQPTHAYDKGKVGTNFTTSLSSDKVSILGNKEIQLEENLVITSDNQDVSLAGVMGFEETGVSKDTEKFILELGRFNIKEVRKTLKTIKMTTQAGIQSSKVLAKGTTGLAIDYLSSKLNSFSRPVNFNLPAKKSIDFSTIALSRVSGFNIVEDERYAKTISSLETLGFKVMTDRIEVPSYRHDVETQQDINEEFLRYFGYDNLPLIAPKINSFKVNKVKDLKTPLAAMGYNEVVTYTLISKEKDIFNPFNFDNSITLETYVSKEREVIRNSQVISILEVLEYNSKRNITDLNIFSEGMVNDGVKTISLASTTKSFNEVKKDLLHLLPSSVKFVKTKNISLHPGVSADIILNGKVIGFIGKVNPKLINEDAFIAEIILPNISNDVKFIEYSNKPLKHRDITFELLPKENISDKIEKIEAITIKVVDKFEKDNINKVTVRFIGTDDQIKEIDNLYN